MTALPIRNIPFEFEDVDFIWNPANPTFSIAMNTLSFFAIGLGKIFLPGDARRRATDQRPRRA